MELEDELTDEPLAAVGTPSATPQSDAAIARLHKTHEDIQRQLKSMMSHMQHISTRDKAFQESFLHTTRKE
eukprot:4154947-Pleurochrysis_carterae.AAC.1